MQAAVPSTAIIVPTIQTYEHWTQLCGIASHIWVMLISCLLQKTLFCFDIINVQLHQAHEAHLCMLINTSDIGYDLRVLRITGD